LFDVRLCERLEGRFRTGPSFLTALAGAGMLIRGLHLVIVRTVDLSVEMFATDLVPAPGAWLHHRSTTRILIMSIAFDAIELDSDTVRMVGCVAAAQSDPLGA